MIKKFWNKKKLSEQFMDTTSVRNLPEVTIRFHVILWTGLLLLIVLITWAGLAKVDEVTKGTGKVIPASKVQIIQHYEGGIVRKVLVSEGEKVKKGQVLMMVDNTHFGSLYRESMLKAAALQAKIARLQAEALGLPLKFNPAFEKKYSNAVKSEKALYKANQEELKSKLLTLHQQLNQKKQELEASKVKVVQLKRSFELVNRELVMTKKLLKDGAASEVEVLRLEREVNTLRGELETAELNIPRLEQAVAESKNKVEELKFVEMSEAAERLTEAKSQFTALKESNRTLQDRATRTTVRSPVNGTINVIHVNTEGGTIKPGMDLMEIIPSSGTLLVEAKVSPKDVAFLHPGQKATVKLTSYDYLVYGSLIGKVEHISADSLEDEKGNSFYIIKVRTDKDFLEHKGQQLPIIPGMMAEVDIITGTKSILDFILKPLLKTKQQALRER